MLHVYSASKESMLLVEPSQQSVSSQRRRPSERSNSESDEAQRPFPSQDRQFRHPLLKCSNVNKHRSVSDVKSDPSFDHPGKQTESEKIPCPNAKGKSLACEGKEIFLVLPPKTSCKQRAPLLHCFYCFSVCGTTKETALLPTRMVL